MKLSSINTILFFVLLFCAVTYKPYMLSNAVSQWKQVFRGSSISSDPTSTTTEFSTLDSLFDVYPDKSFMAKLDSQWLDNIMNANDSIHITIGVGDDLYNCQEQGLMKSFYMENVEGSIYYEQEPYVFTSQGIVQVAKTDDLPNSDPYARKIKLIEIDEKQYARFMREIDFSSMLEAKKQKEIEEQKEIERWKNEWKGYIVCLKPICSYKRIWIEVEKDGERVREKMFDSSINRELLFEMLGMVGELEHFESEIEHGRKYHGVEF